MKPGQMSNVANPAKSEAAGMSDCNSVAGGSMQTTATAQRSMNANRLTPPRQPAGPSGRADVDPSGVMPEQTSDYSKSANYSNAFKKKIYG